jgi:hypothetical protein
MSFAFKYEEMVRKKNPMVDINPLKKTTGKTVNLQDRVDSLNKSALWKKTMEAWTKQGKEFDMSRFPQFTLEELGQLDIQEDIQRELDPKHCAKDIADPDKFDPALVQPVVCIKTSKGKFISIDSQHTVSSVAAMIEAGKVPGVTNWRTFKYPFFYIETDNLAFARRAFGVLNGKGKKRQSQYQQLRNAVYIVRIDKDRTDDTEVELEEKVSIAEKHNCFPVEEKSPLLKYPGTFSNIATFDTLSKEELEIAFAWHDRYFHCDSIHANLFFIFRDLCRRSRDSKLAITDKLKEELAALIQSCFINLPQYSESVKEAYTRWHKNRYNSEGTWNDEAYACGLLQLYQHFGGKERVPLMIIDRFDGLMKFFDQDLLDMAQNFETEYV